MSEGEPNRARRAVKITGSQLLILAILSNHDETDDKKGLVEKPVDDYYGWMPAVGIKSKLADLGKEVNFIKDVTNLRVCDLMATMHGHLGVSAMITDNGISVMKALSNALPEIYQNLDTEYPWEIFG